MFRLKLIKKPILLKLKTNFSFPPIVLANLQEKTVIPTTDQQIVTPDKNYDGLSKVIVEAIQDDNLIPENIKNGVDILGVTGNFVGSKYAPRFITFYAYQGTNLDYETANLDTSNITMMDEMFRDCTKLTSLDLSNFNTSKVTNMHQMFYNCPQLTTLNLSGFDTSNVTTMYSMFYGCQSLTTLDLTGFDTSKVPNLYAMFYNCRKLSNIPKLNASNVINVNEVVYECRSLTDFGGLENLGQAYSTTTSANENTYKLDLSTCRSLTEQSLINVLTNLYDIATKGCNTQSVVLGSTNLAKLTSEEGQSALAQATAYGWTIS